MATNASLFPKQVAGFTLESPLSETAKHNYATYRDTEGRRGYVTASDLRRGLKRVRKIKFIDTTDETNGDVTCAVPSRSILATE